MSVCVSPFPASLCIFLDGRHHETGSIAKADQSLPLQIKPCLAYKIKGQQGRQSANDRVAGRLSKRNWFSKHSTKCNFAHFYTIQWRCKVLVQTVVSHIFHVLLGNSTTDFKTSRNQKMKLTCWPLVFFSYVEKAPVHIQMDLSALQCVMEAKQKFTSMKFAKFLAC
jgi:hypothetical protein